MDYVAIDDFLIKEGISFRFEEFIKNNGSLMNGEHTVLDLLLSVIEQGFQRQKEYFITLLVLCIIFGVVSQIAQAFESRTFEEYGFYIYFIASTSICMELFINCFEMVTNYIHVTLSFMEVLIPTYSISLMFSTGEKSAAGTYGMILGAVYLLQWLMAVIFLPATKILMSIQLANAGTGQAMLSKLCELLSDGVKIGLKIMMGGICGWHFVQSLILPNADALVGEGIYKTLSFLPGIGQLSGAAAKLLIGTATVIKNSIGVGGMLVLIILASTPCITLACYLIGLKLLEAIMQPIVQEKMILMIQGCGQCIILLLRIVTHTFALLFLSLSIITTLS